MSEDKKPEIMTEKEKKKEDKKQAKAYIKAQYNYRIGYLFKAIKTFLKENTKYFIKKYLKMIMIVLALLSIVFVVIGLNQTINGNRANNDIDSLESKNNKLQTQVEDLDSDLKQESNKINAANVSTQSGVQRGKETLDKVFKGMYDYQNSSEYRENREQNLKLFEDPKAKWIKDVYSDDKDEDGNSEIEALGLSSELNETEIYTESIEDTSKKVVPFKVIASYTGNIDNVSSEYATRTHYTVYEVDVDTSNNKIDKMKKGNTVKVNNDIN
ncbi:hypothetical protein MHZ36_12700 [Staphylococcus sp. ACRSN]|uniref:hypothetical protein n=1 Tax=Staphylococcus TaxID=1279 RepID=UPI001EF1DB3D|nr:MULTISPECIES: hypothetical protein [Staphylococcus]MCG7340148.1 hypothetical protein [Staphylococcus sp. ACRSN]MEB6279093.1 hypothetical protein [Staphylococcus gallinarum]